MTSRRANVMRPADMERELNGVNLKLAPPNHIQLRNPEPEEVAAEEAALKDNSDPFWFRRTKIHLPEEFQHLSFVHPAEVSICNCMYNAIHFANGKTSHCLMSMLE